MNSIFSELCCPRVVPSGEARASGDSVVRPRPPSRLRSRPETLGDAIALIQSEGIILFLRYFIKVWGLKFIFQKMYKNRRKLIFKRLAW